MTRKNNDYRDKELFALFRDSNRKEYASGIYPGSAVQAIAAENPHSTQVKYKIIYQ